MISKPKSQMTAIELRENKRERRRALEDQDRRITGSSEDALRRMVARQQDRAPEPEKNVGRRHGGDPVAEAKIKREQHEQYLADLRSGVNPFWDERGRRKLSRDGGRLPKPEDEDED